MGKQQNMGRRSHLEQEAELEQNLASIEQEIGDQPARPSVHGHHISQRSKKEPPIKHTRSGKPHRLM
jgi:hypothetical protein